MEVTAIYPGTFDPITVGHTDVAERVSGMFDRIILAIAKNPSKQPFFSLEERTELASEIVKPLGNVEVVAFDGLLVNVAASMNASVIVRGLRAVSDFDYEMQIAGMNRKLNHDIETVFIAAAQENAFLSSSIVREIAKHQGDVSEFVHPLVLDAFKAKLG
jgi:pantetheine-phosphate adenylyltransferase